MQARAASMVGQPAQPPPWALLGAVQLSSQEHGSSVEAVPQFPAPRFTVVKTEAYVPEPASPGSPSAAWLQERASLAPFAWHGPHAALAAQPAARLSVLSRGPSGLGGGDAWFGAALQQPHSRLTRGLSAVGAGQRSRDSSSGGGGGSVLHAAAGLHRGVSGAAFPAAGLHRGTSIAMAHLGVPDLSACIGRASSVAQADLVAAARASVARNSSGGGGLGGGFGSGGGGEPHHPHPQMPRVLRRGDRSLAAAAYPGLSKFMAAIGRASSAAQADLVGAARASVVRHSNGGGGGSGGGGWFGAHVLASKAAGELPEPSAGRLGRSSTSPESAMALLAQQQQQPHSRFARPQPHQLMGLSEQGQRHSTLGQLHGGGSHSDGGSNIGDPTGAAAAARQQAQRWLTQGSASGHDERGGESSAAPQPALAAAAEASAASRSSGGGGGATADAEAEAAAASAAAQANIAEGLQLLRQLRATQLCSWRQGRRQPPAGRMPTALKW